MKIVNYDYEEEEAVDVEAAGENSPKIHLVEWIIDTPCDHFRRQGGNEVQQPESCKSKVDCSAPKRYFPYELSAVDGSLTLILIIIIITHLNNIQIQEIIFK